MTFTPSLDGLADRLKARKADKGKDGNETVWEAYLRKKKQSKLQKKVPSKIHEPLSLQTSQFLGPVRAQIALSCY